MQLRWEQIDERVARRVQAHITTAPPAAETASAKNAGVGGQAKTVQTGETDTPLEAGWSVFAASIAFFVVALYGTICFHLTGPLFTFALLGMPVGIALVAWLPSTFAARVDAAPPTAVSASAKPRSLRRGPVLRGKVKLTADGLRRAFTQAARTRAEELYGEVVVSLMEPMHGTTRHSGEKAARFGKRREETHSLRLLLNECNTLLDQSFRLQSQSARIGGLWKNGGAISQIQSERFALLQKLDNETDPIVRQSLEESVSLCDERLASVRAYPTLLARLDAHQEVVCQSLALVSSTLARQQAAPHALHAPDVRGLRHALQAAAQQTQAVEAAVLELTPHNSGPFA